EVASKVLRRAQVSKMTRALQNRLALANVKIQHGWQNLSIDTLEPKLEFELTKRKRPGSSKSISETSSSISDRYYPQGLLDSSPLAAPIFSDDIGSREGFGQLKRVKYTRPQRRPVSSSHARTKVRTSTTTATSWKSNYRLPESSPVAHRRSAHFNSSHVPTLSFVSETSTIPDDPLSPSLSEEDDTDLPLHSFQVSSQIRSSPPPSMPRTPPPGLARSARLRNKAFNANGQTTRAGEEGADLLMFLATSPSRGTAKGHDAPPSTPPPKSTPLPSSMMSTPGGGGAPFPGFGLSTPGTAFNFTDYLHLTPSPGQMAAPWTRTPVTAKTPLAAREARRRLNFDGLLPPTSGSPKVGTLERSQSNKGTGLGMELG
ncbi:hypothetical protein M501DRAFT_906475, partial [Patellaria atrata CBS 101060]